MSRRVRHRIEPASSRGMARAYNDSPRLWIIDVTDGVDCDNSANDMAIWQCLARAAQAPFDAQVRAAHLPHGRSRSCANAPLRDRTASRGFERANARGGV